MNLQELRAEFPQFDAVSDGDFALALHKKFYPQSHIKDFMSRIDPEDNARFSITKEAADYWEDQVSRPLGDETEEQAQQRLMGDDMRSEGPGSIEGSARAFGQGLTFGNMDEIVGAGAAAVHPLVSGDDGSTFDERRRQYTSRERGQVDQFRTSHPGTAIASEVLGGLATLPVAPTLGPAKAGATAKAALTGMVYGSGYGAGTSEGDATTQEGRTQIAHDAARSGIVGGAAGGTLALAGRGLGWLFRPTTKAPSLDKIKAASKELVQRAEANGLVVNPGKYQRFLTEAADELHLDPVNHSGTRSILGSLVKESEQPLTPSLIQQLRMRINDGVTSQAGVVDKNGQKALVLLNKFDDMVEGLVADDVASAANPKEVTRWLKQHRALWRRYRKGETLAKAQDLARLTADSNQATDYSQALRTQYRGLSRRIIKGTERGFTKDEAEAIRKAATGTKLNRSLKLLSKFRFDPSGNMIGSGMGAAGGYAVGGVPGALAVPAAGTAASLVNNSLMRGHANRAAQVVGGIDDPIVKGLGLLQQSVPRGAGVMGPVSQAIQQQIAPTVGGRVHPLFAQGQSQRRQPVGAR
jgi:hypothetical protein